MVLPESGEGAAAPQPSGSYAYDCQLTIDSNVGGHWAGVVGNQPVATYSTRIFYR